MMSFLLCNWKHCYEVTRMRLQLRHQFRAGEIHVQWAAGSCSTQFLFHYAEVTNNPNISIAYHNNMVYFLQTLFVETERVVPLLGSIQSCCIFVLQSQNQAEEQLIKGNLRFTAERKWGRNYGNTWSLSKCLLLTDIHHFYSHSFSQCKSYGIKNCRLCPQG